jgi:hypothetical protein
MGPPPEPPWPNLPPHRKLCDSQRNARFCSRTSRARDHAPARHDRATERCALRVAVPKHAPTRPRLVLVLFLLLSSSLTRPALGAYATDAHVSLRLPSSPFCSLLPVARASPPQPVSSSLQSASSTPFASLPALGPVPVIYLPTFVFSSACVRAPPPRRSPAVFADARLVPGLRSSRRSDRGRSLQLCVQ